MSTSNRACSHARSPANWSIAVAATISLSDLDQRRKRQSDYSINMLYAAREMNVELAAIADLHPTQMTIGMREVAIKRKRWREMAVERRPRFLSSRCFPALVGPSGRFFITDRHHLARALRDEGVTHVPLTIVADMSAVRSDVFWSLLESYGWTHPFDDEGRRHRYDDIPASIGNLLDDPFRSLAGETKRRGGYSKHKSPFSEFRWADFLRVRIDRQVVETDFDGAVLLAMDLARSRETMSLPGWRVSTWNETVTAYREQCRH
jgi:hypothetical protein